MIAMKRNIITALCLLTVVTTSAQEKQFNEALNRGRQVRCFYRMTNRKAKMMRTEKVEQLAQRRDFILGHHSTKEIGRFGDVATTIKTWDFIPRSEYQLYLAENLNYGTKSDEYQQEGTVYITDVTKNELTVTGYDNVKWTGAVKNRRIDGTGRGFIREGELRFVAFEGTFSEGIPQGNLSIHIYTPQIKELKYNAKDKHDYQATLGQKSEGMTMVKFKDRYGFINSDGILVAKPVYKEAKDFKDGLAYVTEHNIEMKIDKTGKVVALSETAKLSFAEMLSTRKEYPQLAPAIEDYASNWAEASDRTQDELANVAKEFPALKDKMSELRARLYKKNGSQLWTAYQLAVAAADNNERERSGENVTDNFINVYTTHAYDPDTLMPMAKRLKRYQEVCGALDLSLHSSYWTASYCPTFSSDGDKHKSSLSKAIDICVTDTCSDFAGFFAQAQQPLRDKLDRLKSRLASDRADYEEAYARYKIEEARREAERKAEEARREAKRQQVREILKNMSAGSIWRYVVKSSEWSEGRMIDTDENFEDHKDIVFRDIESDDPEKTFSERIYHRFKLSENINYYYGGGHKYTNETDATIAAFLEHYNRSWYEGRK